MCPLSRDSNKINQSLEKFLCRFANRYDAYYIQVPNEKRYQARWQHLGIDQLIDHVEGTETLALPAVDRDGMSKWIAFDSDHDDGALARVEKFLTSEGWHVLRESKREGREGHLWLMLDESVGAAAARRFTREILERVGLESDDLECLPKQSTSGKLGSSLRLPLGINMKPGVWQRGWFDGVTEDVHEQLVWFAQQPLNKSQRIQNIYRQLVHQDELKAAATFRPVGILERKHNQMREKTDLLKLVPSHKMKRVGDHFEMRCPVCEQEGHDKHEDNLHIDPSDGTLFCCWWGNNPGNIHTAVMILNAFGV